MKLLVCLHIRQLTRYLNNLHLALLTIFICLFIWNFLWIVSDSSLFFVVNYALSKPSNILFGSIYPLIITFLLSPILSNLIWYCDKYFMNKIDFDIKYKNGFVTISGFFLTFLNILSFEISLIALFYAMEYNFLIMNIIIVLIFAYKINDGNHLAKSF